MRIFSLCIVQLPFLIFIGMFFLGIIISLLNIVPIILVMSVSILMFVLLGFIIAAFSKTESTAILASMIILVPMIFLSGAFIPIEVMPLYIRAIADHLPVVLSIRLVEGLIFYGLNIVDLFLIAAQLFIYIIMYGVIAWVLIKKELK